MDIIGELTRVLDARRNADPETSYVAALYEKGTDKILEKVGEEATEVLIAAKNLDAARTGGGDAERLEQALVGEAADLWFHTMVVLMHLEVTPQAVLERLQNRFGLSGHDEKGARGASGDDSGEALGDASRDDSRDT